MCVREDESGSARERSRGGGDCVCEGGDREEIQAGGGSGHKGRKKKGAGGKRQNKGTLIKREDG